MRISDWSSDVCSSDLATAAAAFAVSRQISLQASGSGRNRPTVPPRGNPCPATISRSVAHGGPGRRFPDVAARRDQLLHVGPGPPALERHTQHRRPAEGDHPVRHALSLGIRPGGEGMRTAHDDHLLDAGHTAIGVHRSEEHTSELQSLMRISYAVFCFKKKKKQNNK